MKRALTQTYSLWLRDMKHIVRQPGRMLSYIGQPLLVWLFLGAGFRNSFESGADMTYSEYLYPGILILVSLFSAIFSTISIIEDRKSGFLQGVLAAPVPRSVVALSKVLSGTTLGLGQAVIFLLLIPVAGLQATFASALLALAVLFIIGMTFTNIGFAVSWKLNSTQGFHAVMNMLLMPLWLLSGAFFPPDKAAGWMQWIVKLNPLYYMNSLFADTLYAGSSAAHAGPGIALSLGVTLAAFVLLTTNSIRVART
ncbi:MAG: multidrug ABC transporter permease [Ectothiorhodospiraceae bacterium]|nr:multidrug ABC transporter permease [Ectothiorhodospiraceae bacterium]